MQANFLQRVMYSLAVVGVICGPAASLAFGQVYEDMSVTRIALELRDLNRLTFKLNRDEQHARQERDLLVKNRANAVKFVDGGTRRLHRIGFLELVQSMEQSPAQVSLFQMEVPALAADDFTPTATTGFPGGNVHELLRFCSEHQVNVEPGGEAQLVLAELASDVIHAADARILELNERIEDLKAQSIAQADLLERLMLAHKHCHYCRGCWAHGYGWCGATSIVVVEEPAAGWNSMTYYRTLPRR